MKTPLYKSRKFWIMIVDLVSSLVLYFTAKYLAPGTVDDIKFLVAALQPVILLVVASLTVENVVTFRAAK